MPQGDRIKSIDMARGIAVILVVLMHASIMFPHPAALQSFNSVLGGLRMPLLMLISGFLVAPSLRSHRPLAPRVATLSWLFACWSLVIWAVLAMLNGVSPDPAKYLEEFVAPTTALWFLWALALMTAAIALTPERYRVLLIVVAGAASMATRADLIHVDLFSFNHALQSGVFFFIGAIFPGALQRAMRGSPLSCLALAVPSIGLALGVDHVLKLTLGLPLFGIPERLIACVVALQLCMLMARARVVANILAWFGRNTLPVFVSHQLLMAAAMSVFAVADLGPGAIPLLTIGALAASIGLRSVLLRLNAVWLYELPAPLCRLANGTHTMRAVVGAGRAIATSEEVRRAILTVPVIDDRVPGRWRRKDLAFAPKLPVCFNKRAMGDSLRPRPPAAAPRSGPMRPSPTSPS